MLRGQLAAQQQDVGALRLLRQRDFGLDLNRGRGARGKEIVKRRMPNRRTLDNAILGLTVLL